MMKEVWYLVILAYPAFLTVFVPFMVLYLMGYRVKHLRHWVVPAFAFSRIIKTKTDDRGETRWLFKDLDLTDEEQILTKIQTRLFYLFLVLFYYTVSLFYQLLLLDVNFGCERNGKTHDCFNRDVLPSNQSESTFMQKLLREPIDCSSVAAQNGTMEVIMCYKIVFNFGLAAGASYGVFHLLMVVISVATSAMLMAKQAKTILKIRIILGLLSLGLLAAIAAVAFTPEITSSAYFMRSFNFSDYLVTTIQGILSVISVDVFVFGIPWKKLIELKAARARLQQRGSREQGVQNPAADTGI